MWSFSGPHDGTPSRSRTGIIKAKYARIINICFTVPSQACASFEYQLKPPIRISHFEFAFAKAKAKAKAKKKQKQSKSRRAGNFFFADEKAGEH